MLKNKKEGNSKAKTQPIEIPYGLWVCQISPNYVDHNFSLWTSFQQQLQLITVFAISSELPEDRFHTHYP